MKKFIYFLFALLFLGNLLIAQVPKEIIIATTGYGFDRNAQHANAQWDYIQKFVNLTYNGQDASVTAVRFYINWEHYEPTLGDYQRAKLVEAIQDLTNLKGGTFKVALHFPYQRPGAWNDSYFDESDIERIYDGTLVRDNVAFTNPSIYSETARNRFLAFVNDALAQLGSFYDKILYVQMGLSSAEEYAMPLLDVNNYVYTGMHGQRAADAWHNEYLPCRYPGQSTVTWDGNTYNIASAPLGAQGQWPSWNTDHGKEFHRFASWGLMRFYKQFRDVVKNHSNNLKVLYYVSDFGTSQGNTVHMHNASLRMAMDEFDGISTTEGVNIDYLDGKILALDVMKGTNPNKIAATEMDPSDCGEAYAGTNNILTGVADQWIPRMFKHGADYVHLAMHYHDPAIETLKPALALIRANYVNGSYQAPSRQSPTTVNISPTVFTGTHLFQSTWSGLNGNNWGSTDNNPVSINMIDDGYWENVAACLGSTPPDPCNFSVEASGPTNPVNTGSQVTLNASCFGQCSGVSYSWSGNGISGSNSSVQFNAPGTPGSYTYTVTASKSNCSNKIDTISITVVDSGGGPCNFTEKGVVGTWNGLQVQTRQFTINGQLKWAVVILETTPNVDRHFVRGDNFVDRGDVTWNNGPIQKSCLGAGETGWGGLGFPSGITIPTGYIQDTMPDGAIYFELSSCTPPSAPSLNANPSTITSGDSTELTATGCAGTVTWSHGLGTGNTKTVSPTSTTTYTATCTVDNCTSTNGSVQITVNPPSGGPNCNTLISDVNGVNCMFIEGWIYDPSNPGMTINIDIYEGATLLFSNYPANKFRQDLLDDNYGNGEHAFELATPSQLKDGQNHTLTFKASACSNYQLNNSPYVFVSSGCSNAVLNTDITDEVQQRELKVFPNPSNGTFETSFYLERGKRATMVLTDIQGRTLLSKAITGNGTHLEKISVPNKAAGTMFLRIIKDNGVEVKKINIVR